MKIRTLLMTAALLAFCGTIYAEDEAAATMEKPAMTKEVYVCPDCHAAMLKAGTCACGKELVKMHLLGTENGQALLCSCGETCNCDFMGMKDGKCACGKEVKKAALHGVYSCPKGCPLLSDKAGKCACGEEMTKVE